MQTMYYAVTVEDREMIAAATDIHTVRYWAGRWTRETGGRAIVCEGVEFYEKGERVLKKDVNLNRFKP